ncbi:hypothetical protein HPP05_09045 [Corallococcus exiguus]|uniref:hypothetical protein n=1 Tax=Corallococcus exiguus TaxID=83462 RepID=UPI00149479F8|nr:hypothetical protein [Corallococcus exiguus]NPC69894.1 hypothetical protein [Corallococcus exiguus]
MKQPSTPRIELYREAVRDSGAPGGGRPVVERCELVPPAGVDPLSLKLSLLPSFHEEKPTTTLGAYFEAQSKGIDFPRSLDGYNSHDEAERRTFTTLLEAAPPRSHVIVAWRDERHWYVDELFYRLEGVDGGSRGEWTEVVEGSLADFIRFSPLIQSQSAHPADDVVLELSKSPGMPNTRHFNLEVFADGRFEVRRPREHDSRGSDVHRLTTLLIAASRLPAERGPSFPRPFAHDAQTRSVTYVVAGRRIRVTLDADTPPDILSFANRMAAAYDVEL